QARLMREVESGRQASLQMEKRYIRKDGSLVWVNLTASLVRDAAGLPLYWIAMAENISERKRASEELRVSEERFRLAAATASDLIFEANLDTGEVELIGDGLTGREREDGRRRTIDALVESIHPDDRERLICIIESHKETRQPFRAELRLLVPDGPARSVTVH